MKEFTKISPEIGPQTGFRALDLGFLAFGVFLARGAEFPTRTNSFYALVKFELAKVENGRARYENRV